MNEPFNDLLKAHERAEEEITRLYASWFDQATRDGADIVSLETGIERLHRIVRRFLDCPEIADCAPEDKDPDTAALEREARAALPKETI